MPVTATRPPTVIHDAAEWQAFWERLNNHFDRITFEPVLTAHIAVLEISNVATMLGQTDPAGNAWPPLAPATVRRKGHNTILWETGALSDSLTESGSQYAIREIKAPGKLQTLQFGTRRPWAGTHQRGTDRIPQRKHTGTTADNVRQLVAATLDAMVEHMSQPLA